MGRRLALTTLLAAALVVTSHAQKTSFSGAWTIDQAATDAANTPTKTAGGRLTTMPTGFPMTITHTADSFAIERRAGDTGARVTTTYKLDGIEREVRTSQGTAKAKAWWDGDKIVIETVGAGSVTTTVTYAIDKGGVLWVETKSPQGTTKRAFRK